MEGGYGPSCSCVSDGGSRSGRSECMNGGLCFLSGHDWCMMKGFRVTEGSPARVYAVFTVVVDCVYAVFTATVGCVYAVSTVSPRCVYALFTSIFAFLFGDSSLSHFLFTLCLRSCLRCVYAVFTAVLDRVYAVFTVGLDRVYVVFTVLVHCVYDLLTVESVCRKRCRFSHLPL